MSSQNSKGQEQINDLTWNTKVLNNREKINSTICPICGNDAAGMHLHYGGRGCSSCRAFFGRSVQNSSFKVRMLYLISHFVRF